MNSVIHSLFAIPILLIFLFLVFFFGIYIYVRCRLAVKLFSSFFVKLFRSFKHPAKVKVDKNDVELERFLPPQILGGVSDGDASGSLEPRSQKPHFADIMREMRAAGGKSLTFPNLTVAEIHQASCTPDTKSECWGCGDQICVVRQSRPDVLL